METKIAKLSQDNQCHVQNAEAVKKGLEAKLKQQEKDLKGEASEAQSLVNSLSKEIEETKKQISQEKTAALQTENQGYFPVCQYLYRIIHTGSASKA